MRSDEVGWTNIFSLWHGIFLVEWPRHSLNSVCPARVCALSSAQSLTHIHPMEVEIFVANAVLWCCPAHSISSSLPFLRISLC